MNSLVFRRAFSFLSCLLVGACMLLLCSAPAHAQSGRKPKRDLPASGKPANTADKKPDDKLESKPNVKVEYATEEEKAEAAKDGAALRVETTLVTIPASVLDRDGAYVPFIEKKEFHLYENGIEQEIASVTKTSAPFHVVLMLDTSGSTVMRLEDIQRAAIAFVKLLGREDKVMVVSFDSKVYVDSEFTSDRAKLEEAILRTKTGGNTSLYDAVELVLEERLRDIKGRKAVVLLTDGVDTSSRATARGTIKLVEEAETQIFPLRYDTSMDGGRTVGIGTGGGGGSGPLGIPPPIGFPGPGGRMPSPIPGGGTSGGSMGDYISGREYLQTLAKHSGGRLYNADTIGSVSGAFAKIAEELRHQYALAYYPSNTAQDGSWRTVKVRVDRPDLIVRAREGYRAKGGALANAEEKEKKGKRPVLNTRKDKNKPLNVVGQGTP
ncbi:MAG: VWA domain-containing protein [Blastocatellia bacterium]